MNTEKRLFLLDAYALIFRAYYAFINNQRYNSKGLNTSAILGFTNSLEEILNLEKPTHIAVVFDYPAKNFRSELYPLYKAQRLATPEDIKKAVPYIKEIISGFNIPIFEIEGFEADDTIGTLAKKAEKAGFKVFMVTPDKDFNQLVSQNIFVYKPKKGGKEIEIVGEEEVKKEFGIQTPTQFIDILALWGDTSDNVPGIVGIGEKTAVKLINQYGNIENIYKNLTKIFGKQKENLINGRKQLMLSRELVTIRLDVDVEFDEKIFEIKPLNEAKLTAVFEELEFKAAATRILGNLRQENIGFETNKNIFGESENQNTTNNFKTIENTTHLYYLIDNHEKRQNLIQKLNQLNEFCFDTETTGLDVRNCEIVGLSISYKLNEAYYISFPQSQLKTQEVLEEFRNVFENSKIRKIGQNIKFDIAVLKQYSIEVKGELFDTMLAHYLLEPDLRHNLDYLCETYLNYKPIPIENLIGEKGKNQGNMRNVSITKIVDYACEDADLTFQLKEIFEPRLKIENLEKLAKEIEMPLIYVLADMEYTGVNLNSDFLLKYEKELVKKIIEIEDKIFELAGEKFNVASPKQLGDILFEKLKVIDNAKLTKTKQYATGEDELLKLKDKHPIINLILEYRGLKKLLNTYVETLPKIVNPRTNKIHTSYNQAVASTGRLSSNNPNLQNIPIRTPEGREIRKAFIPSTDEHIFIDADYSQIELRLMAHLSQDKNMLEAFNNKEDIHTATAAKMFKIPISEVTHDMRYKAKAANFAIIYGASATGLSQNLNISRSDATALRTSYFETYPNVKLYMENCIKKASNDMEVVTLMGRKRHLPDINSQNSLVKGNAERNAINAPIQGSAADIIKIAMINIFNRLNRENLKSKMILQVHDELIIDTLKSEVEIVKEIIKFEMENAVNLSIPLDVEVNVGNNWSESH